MQPADKSRYYLKAAALGGLAGGVLSVIPVISACNIICCLWLVGAGFLAVHLVQKWSYQSVTPGEGATVGLLAGLCAGIFASALSAPFAGSRHAMMAPQLERMPPEVRQMTEHLLTGGAFWAITIVAFLVMGAVFGTLGGLLAAAVLAKRDQI